MRPSSILTEKDAGFIVFPIIGGLIIFPMKKEASMPWRKWAFYRILREYFVMIIGKLDGLVKSMDS